MNKSKLSKSILKRIETENIQPTSKWYFVFKNLSFWIFFALAMMVGAISFSIMVYALQNTDFEMLQYLEESEGLSEILAMMPFLWVFAIGMATGIGIWGLKNTKRGYRIAIFGLIGSNILGSMFLGSLVHGVGGGEYIEEILEEKVEFYEGVRKKHQKFWGNPEVTGRLGGIVQSVDKTTQTMTISGPRGRTWEVKVEDSKYPIEIGKPIKMKGQFTPGGQFKPAHIKPALRHEKMHRKIKRHFEKNPELREKVKSFLPPETQEKFKTLENKDISPAQRHEIMREVRQTLTPAQREEIHQEVKASIKQEQQERRELKQKIDTNLEPSERKALRQATKSGEPLSPALKQKINNTLTPKEQQVMKAKIQETQEDQKRKKGIKTQIREKISEEKREHIHEKFRRTGNLSRPERSQLQNLKQSIRPGEPARQR